MTAPDFNPLALRDQERPDAIGTEEGAECNRWTDADEDCPTSWKCKGMMLYDGDGDVRCDVCGELA